MFNLFTYSHLTAKINAMRGKMLTLDDYAALINSSSVTDFVLYLKERTYYSAAFEELRDVEIHRGFVEVLLYRSEMMDAVKIGRYLKGQERILFRYVYRRQEIEDLKKMLRILQTGKPLDTLNRNELFISKYNRIEFDEALNSHTVEELVDSLKGTNFYNLLHPLLIGENRIDLFSAEVTLDMYYYQKLMEQLKKSMGGSNKEIVRRIFGMDADIRNILWIYRTKKYYNVSKELIYRYLIPMAYKLSKTDTMRLVESPTVEEFLEQLQSTYYGDIVDTEPIHWETNLMRRLFKLQSKTMREFPYSVAPIVGYITLKQIEINNIITILEGVRYKTDPEEIRLHLTHLIT